MPFRLGWILQSSYDPAKTTATLRLGEKKNGWGQLVSKREGPAEMDTRKRKVSFSPSFCPLRQNLAFCIASHLFNSCQGVPCFKASPPEGPCLPLPWHQALHHKAAHKDRRVTSASLWCHSIIGVPPDRCSSVKAGVNTVRQRNSAPRAV